jgi:MFS transporter, ACS family, glucarate transporter
VPRPDFGLGRNNGLLFWAHVVWGSGFAVQITLWTLFIQSLGASPAQIGLVVGGGAVVRTLLAMPAGALVDRVSPKPVILLGMSMPIAATFVFVLSTEWWHALIGAVLLETSGIAVPAVSAYIAAGTPEQDRTRAYTYIYTLAYSIGLMTTPALAGFVAETAGFRVVYGIAGLLFVGGVLILAFLQNTRPESTSDVDGQPRAKVTYRQVMRLPAVWVVFGFHLLVPLLPFLGIVLLPNFLNEERGLSLTRIGLLGSVGYAAGFGIGLLVSHWKPLTQPFLGLAFCLALITGSFVIFLSSSLFAIILIGYMLRTAMGPAWSLMAAAVAEVTPERMRGRAYGLCELGAGMGDVTAPIVAGQVYGVSPYLTLWVALVTTAPLSLAALIIHRARERLVPPSMRHDGVAGDPTPA